jgi:AbrB family looped-hinge helix DNA binding protein
MSARTGTRLSSKFQISVPKAVRESQGWKAGQEFAFVPTGNGGVELVRVPTLEELRGMFKGADSSDIRDHTDRY